MTPKVVWETGPCTNDIALNSENCPDQTVDQFVNIESCGTYTQWRITQPLKTIHLNQF